VGQEPRTGETRVNGRFLDRRVCSLGLFALTFQAQFDEVLPKLAVVHDFSLQRDRTFKGIYRPGYCRCFYGQAWRVRHQRADNAAS
jgi:hypothetical protein